MFGRGDVPFSKGLERGMIKQRELSRLGIDRAAGSKTVVRDKAHCCCYDHHNQYPSVIYELDDET